MGREKIAIFENVLYLKLAKQAQLYYMASKQRLTVNLTFQTVLKQEHTYLSAVCWLLCWNTFKSPSRTASRSLSKATHGIHSVRKLTEEGDWRMLSSSERRVWIHQQRPSCVANVVRRGKKRTSSRNKDEEDQEKPICFFVRFSRRLKLIYIPT